MFNILLTIAAVFPNFSEAEANYVRTEKPLLVILTGNGCAPCEILKKRIIQPMIDSGEIKTDIVIVNRDKEDRRIIERLTNLPQIPQSILLFRKDGKWRKATLVGILQSEAATKQRILDLIKYGEK